MDDTHNDSGLPLPDFYIENFRGIKKLTIPRLGRVTLLAGKNGVGKTTVLEAVEVFAERARYTVLQDILLERDEVSYALDENREKYTFYNWDAIFYGRDISSNVRTKLGPIQDRYQLILEPYSLLEVILEAEESFARWVASLSFDSEPFVLRASFQGNDEIIPALLTSDKDYDVNASDPIALEQELNYLARRFNSRRPSSIKCERIGHGSLKNFQLPRLWGQVALTDDESQVIQALKIAYGEEVDRVSVVSDEAASNAFGGQRAIVKLKGLAEPVPLKSLGGGATWLFGVALALAYCKDGFLLIDEAENGVHHTVHRDYWRMLLETAYENNVQVFATTHSWDCVKSFAQAAADFEDAEGVLVRLEKEDERMRAVRYSERRSKIAAEQGVEVR